MGTRLRTEVAVPGPVSTAIHDCAAQNGCIAEQAAADLLAVATGRLEGVRHLGQVETQRLASEWLAGAVNGVDTRARQAVR